MDANDIINALNGVLNLGDTLDNSGAGLLTASNGQHATRDVIKMELGSFLLYVGDGGSFFTDGQASLVNLLLADRFGEIPEWRMSAVASELGTPDPDENASGLPSFQRNLRSYSARNHTWGVKTNSNPPGIVARNCFEVIALI